uniref:ABC-type xenobiotic transporter n=1 Tax=Laodelphax striatellus TaxID=195883 RepID=A0A158V3H1_LAOST|nr:multidrug resistance-associated protein 5-like protein [Laodelphax striatellus]
MRWNWNWTEFCGTSDGFVTWDEQLGDVGMCCQALCLHIPALFLMAMLSSHYCGKQAGWVVRSSTEIYVLRIRCAVSMLLAFAPIVRSLVELNDFHITLFPVNHTLVAVECLSWLVHSMYIHALRHRLGPSLRGPTVMNVLLTINYALALMTMRSQYLLHMWAAPLAFAILRVILQTIYIITLFPSSSAAGPGGYIPSIANLQATESSPLLHAYSRFREDMDPGYLGVAIEGWGWISQLFFSWAGPLMEKGALGEIHSPDDLYDLPVSLSASHLHDQLESSFTDQSLFKALHRCYWKEFYGIGILKLVSDVSGFLGPLLLNRLVLFVENRNEPIHFGYLYAAGLFMSSLIVAFCTTHFNFLMGKVGLKIRGSLITTIYKKTLKLNSISLSKFSIGEIVNFMSTDTDRIVGACPSFHAFWSIPFQLAVTLYLLFQQVGISFLAGLIFSIVLIPINKCIASCIGNLSKKMMDEKDKRVKMSAEALRGIKVIKMHVWEEYFVEKIMGIRSNEMKYLKGRKYLDAMCVYFWATTPVLIALLTFTVYTLLGHKLNAATVFTSIALFNMLISPLNAFPWVLNGLTESWVSLQRIQKLVQIKEQELSDYYSDMPTVETVSEGALVIHGGHFHWGTGNFQLSSINLAAIKGQLIGITGRVGSGKSSFLMALLAEMEKTVGFVAVPDAEHGFGLVSQTPWLQNGTIRDNILFGKPFDHNRYKKVLHACALNEDLKILPGGDLANVGERGSALSGGQKARVSLARAVYHNRNVYLLDDIFSAVDPRVGRHIFHFCINGLLKEKIRLLCTHHTQFLLGADQVLVLEDGAILKQGRPQDVLPDYEEDMTQNQLMETEVIVPGSPTPSIAGASIASAEPTDAAPADSQAESEEWSGHDSVSWNAYSRYWSAIGYGLSIAILLSIFLMQASRNATDWWLALWVTNARGWNTTVGLTLEWEDSDSDSRKYLIVYACIAGLNSIFNPIRAFLFALGGLTAASKLHNALLNTIICAQSTFFDVTPTGRILNRLSSDTYTIDDSLPFIANIFLAQIFGLIGTVIVTVYGLPWLTLLLLPLIPIYLWIQNHYRLTSRELKRLATTSLSPLYSHFNESLEGLVTIRAFRASSRFWRHNELCLESNQKVQLASHIANQWLNLRLQLIGVAMVTSVSVLSIFQHAYNIANPGLLGLALSYVLGVTGQLGGVVYAFAETEREMVSVERVDQALCEIRPERFAAKLAPPYAWPGQGVIIFNNVYLRYRQCLQPSLKGISFSTRPAERIGIVGRTGAGKSSLLASLFRLVELSSGQIVIDTVDIAMIGLRQLRSRLAVIPQDVFVWGSTLRENVDPGGLFPDADVWRALERCHLAAVVRAQGGLRIPLVPDKTFSNGQAQLLCLARALLKNAKILCIDEATASVDEETDRKIQETIRTSFRQCTVLTIAHRISTIMNSDRVLVMGDGEVLEFDTPETLLETKTSHFCKLVHKDFE